MKGKGDFIHDVIASTSNTNNRDDSDSGFPFVIEMAGMHYTFHLKIWSLPHK